jgi:hypothetical protein
LIEMERRARKLIEHAEISRSKAKQLWRAVEKQGASPELRWLLERGNDADEWADDQERIAEDLALLVATVRELERDRTALLVAGLRLIKKEAGRAGVLRPR